MVSNYISKENYYSLVNYAPSFEPSLKNVVDQKTLKWIFVGGKGGVGKTTVSSSLSTLLAKTREKVLIISTDPAHNLSDAFNQSLESTPTLIKGTTNLYGCEIDPKSSVNPYSESGSMNSELNNILGFNPDEGTKNFLNELLTSFPGIDETMCIGYVMKIVKELDFSCVVFDTAPTGHTLRLLKFPNLMEKGLEKLLTFKEKVGSIVNSLGMLGGNNFNDTFEKMFCSFNNLKENVEIIQKEFTDNVRYIFIFTNINKILKALTTFVAVCIPEFLSMYETERLTEDLIKFEIDIRNVVINQVLMNDTKCEMCVARQIMQKKYVKQITDLFEDFHISVMPLLPKEVRGYENLSMFSSMLC